MIHGLVTAGIVAWLGHDWVLPATVVAVSHWMIDFGKARNRYDINIDQGLHFAVLVVVTLSFT